MKKLVTSGFKGSLCTSLTLMVMLLFTSIGTQAQQGCVMACPPMEPPVEIGLSSQCSDILTYTLIGVVLDNCPGEITVNILDDNGMSLGNIITDEMIGNIYMVIITHTASGQLCMTQIKVVDNQAPVVICPANVTLGCATDLTQYSGLSEGDISDCSGTIVNIDDELLFSGMCIGNIVSQYQRTYTVIDDYLNVSTCVQTISLLKANLINVLFPPNHMGANALDCFPPPDLSPASLGYPTVNGDEILVGTFCNLSAGFTDNQVPLCSGSYKLFRTWTVVDWCAGNQSSTMVQIIEVLDQTSPVVNAPSDVTVSTGASSCNADVILSLATILEDCSTIWAVRMEGPFGTIHSNGGLLVGLPLGVHRIIFKATNDCGLTGVDTMYITVQDLQPPAPVCHQFVAIPVNNEGFATIPASVFNAGSSDNCGLVYFKVKRMSTPVGYTCANPGNPANQFDDFIQFCCEDIANNNIMVILRVYDVPPIAGPVADNYLLGHYNDCMVQVEVQDKLPPQIICPSNLTISCEFPFTTENLEVFGAVALSEAEREMICIDDPGVPGDPGLQCIGLDGVTIDNCLVDIEELAPVITINNCGVGTILRTFRATDDGGLQATCQQTITIINYDLFGLSDITWPLDYTTFNTCEIDLLDPDDLVAPFNEPVLTSGVCDLVGFDHDDDVFDFSNTDQACFKILRTWTVIDWCQLNTQSGGIWTHIQVIKVMNNVAPTIEPIADRTECSFDPQCGGLTLDFEANATDDCSGPASLSWKYFIDLDNNQSFEYTSGVIIGDSINFSRYMPIGSHRVIYTVWDKCGNTTTEEQFVTVESCKPPSAICIHGLSTNLMAMDTDGDGIADWGMVTLQASMFDAGSAQPCGNPVTVAFSADPTDVTRVFDCSNLGIQEIEIWVIDDRGLTDFCITTIYIQDNNNICPQEEGGTGIISGNVTVPEAGKLSGAMIYLDGSNLSGIPTGIDGHFVFPSMDFGGAYVVRPVRDGDARNGVTTLDLVKIQKHLLGIENFSTPYQYIAADANNSSSITAIDIIQLRKLILGFYSELPSNKSWRFIDKAHIFPDPFNPWVSPWPETYSIIPFASSMNDVDFHAVKVGDLNHSANLQAGNGMILPRGDQHCQLSYDVVQQGEENIYKVDIYLDHADEYTALQFSFNWDQAGFALMDWNAGESFSRDDVRMPEKPSENASIAAYAIDGWSDNRLPVLTLWVEELSHTGLPFKLFLNAGPTEPIAYRKDTEDGVSVQLQGIPLTETRMYNKPNPFRDWTQVMMKSSREEKAVLRIFDLNGRMVYSKEISLIKGENEFFVHKAELKSIGIFMYEIESNFQYSTNRMIIVD